jgi:hypothetical protein
MENRSNFTVEMIRDAAVRYYSNIGRWPTTDHGIWAQVDEALRLGYRGFPGGSSLEKFLDEQFPERKM